MPGPIIETLFAARPFQIARRNIQPPSDLLLPPESSLSVTTRGALAGNAFTIRARVLLPNGTVQRNEYLITDPGTRVATTQICPIGGGFLLSVLCSAPSVATQRGALFVRIQQLIGGPAAETGVRLLLSDYHTTSALLSWPSGRQISSVEGPGAFRAIDGTQPAAGADWVEAVPTGARWRLHAVKATLTCGVVVATRYPRLTLRPPVGGIPFRVPPAVGVVAGSFTDFNWYGTAPAVALVGVVPDVQTFATPPELILSASWTIGVQTTALQAADQWSAPSLVVEEWLG